MGDNNYGYGGSPELNAAISEMCSELGITDDMSGSGSEMEKYRLVMPLIFEVLDLNLGDQDSSDQENIDLIKKMAQEAVNLCRMFQIEGCIPAKGSERANNLSLFDAPDSGNALDDYSL